MSVNLHLKNEPSVSFGCCQVEVSLYNKFQKIKSQSKPLPTGSEVTYILQGIQKSNSCKKFFIRPLPTFAIAGAVGIGGVMFAILSALTLAILPVIMGLVLAILGFGYMYLLAQPLTNLKYAYESQNRDIQQHLQELANKPGAFVLTQPDTRL